MLTTTTRRCLPTCRRRIHPPQSSTSPDPPVAVASPSDPPASVTVVVGSGLLLLLLHLCHPCLLLHPAHGGVGAGGSRWHASRWNRGAAWGACGACVAPASGSLLRPPCSPDPLSLQHPLSPDSGLGMVHIASSGGDGELLAVAPANLGAVATTKTCP